MTRLIKSHDTIGGYIHTFETNLDVINLRRGVLAMNNYVMNTFGNLTGRYADGNAPKSTQLFDQYNALMYPYPELYNVGAVIKEALSSLVDVQKNQYYAQAWVNVYEKGQFVDWHTHWRGSKDFFHGFVCVDCGDSKTTYKLNEENDPEEIDVPSKDGMMVISRSDTDMHRTYPWPEENTPRITVAFDLLPAWALYGTNLVNHWVPIV